MARKHIHYAEGQWFAVPLKQEGYALGIIVRGCYRMKGGLGYFFGPKYSEIPDQAETLKKNAHNALLVAWFGDLGIISGRWPLIPSTRPFEKFYWPVPKFRRIDSINREIGWLIEYEQENPEFIKSKREVLLSARELSDLPEDGLYGAAAIELKLSTILSVDHEVHQTGNDDN